MRKVFLMMIDQTGLIENGAIDLNAKTNEEIMYKILDLNEVIDGMFETWDLAIEDENTDDFQVYLALENMIEAETRLCMQFLGVSIEEILEDIKSIDK